MIFLMCLLPHNIAHFMDISDWTGVEQYLDKDLSNAPVCARSRFLEMNDSVIRHSPDSPVNYIIVEIKLAIHTN